MNGKQGFKDRTNLIFGALDSQDGGQGKWHLADHQVFEAGRDANYSSDEDREAEKLESSMPSKLFFEGTEKGEGPRIMPSNAFCRALDKEPEMDANDAVAEALSYSRREARPSRKTEVLDDNVFDKQSKVVQEREHSRHLPSSATPMEIDIPMPVGSPSIQEDPENPDAATRLRMSVVNDVSTLGVTKPPPPPLERPPLESISPRRRSSEGKGTQRKVRFGEVTEFPDSKPDISRPGTPSVQDVGNGSKKSLQAPTGNDANSSRPSSYVPDHVRHPEKYTAYVLETPIVVGSGIDGSNPAFTLRLASQKEPESGLDNQYTAEEQVPASAGGITFNPARRKTTAQVSSTNELADRINQGSVKPIEAELDAEIQDLVVDTTERDQVPDGKFKNTGKRNRNLRSRNTE